MKISILTSLILLLALIFLWNYTNSFTTPSIEPMIGFLVFFILVPIFIYSLILTLKKIILYIEEIENNSISYYLYQIFKAILGIISICYGLYTGYLTFTILPIDDFTTFSKNNSIILIIQILLIYGAFYMGTTLLANFRIFYKDHKSKH